MVLFVVVVLSKQLSLSSSKMVKSGCAEGVVVALCDGQTAQVAFKRWWTKVD